MLAGVSRNSGNSRNPITSIERASKHPLALDVAQAWQLTRELSPRSFVKAARLGDRDTNTYPIPLPLTAGTPRGPWAMLLTDEAGDYRFLAFDFDPGVTPDAAVDDAQALASVLDTLSIPYVTCASGRPGGRHLWVGLHEPLEAHIARHLGRIAKLLYPTLDTSPLSNAGAGAVRPPGAPHRFASPSTVLAGDLNTLRDPWVSFHDVARILTHLSSLVDDTHPLEPHTIPPLGTPLPVDDDGHLYLPGPRASLPAAARAALETPIADHDASAIAWRILTGAVRASWRYEHIAQLVDTAPGLEHFRTSRGVRGRIPRPTTGATSTDALLRRQWDRAVRRVAAAAPAEDPTFASRAAQVAAHVDHQLDRIRSTPGRWSTEHGAQDRDVLEELLLLALEGVTLTVQASSRTLASRIGVSYSTVQRALARLASDNTWIRLAKTGDRHLAHTWDLTPPTDATSPVDNSAPQVSPPPAPPGTPLRALLLRELRAARSTVTHDLLGYRDPTARTAGIGRLRAHVYRTVGAGPTALLEAAELLGLAPARTQALLRELGAIGIVEACANGWTSAAPGALDAEAAVRGLTGRLDRLRQRCANDQQLWAWWLAELDWMTTPHRSSQHRRPGRGQLSLLPGGGTPLFAPYPRHPDGRADHGQARRELLREPASVLLDAARAASQSPSITRSTGFRRAG